MTALQNRIVLAGIVFLALLMHVHYIEYGVAHKGHVFKLFPSHSAEAQRIGQDMAYSYLYRQKILGSMSPYLRQAYADGHIDNGDLAEFAVAAGIQPPPKRKVKLNAINSKPIYFGLLPARTPKAVSERTTHEAFWFGVMVPLALAVLVLFFSTTRMVSEQPAKRRQSAVPAPPVQPITSTGDSETDSQPKISLAELLLADLGSDFPVKSGNAKKDDPLIITATKDYVAVEYAVVRHVLGRIREDYELSQQAVATVGDRTIDELIFEVKPAGATDWTGRRRFYFDVTLGFHRLRR